MLGAGLDSSNNRLINLYAKNFTDKYFKSTVPLMGGGVTRLTLGIQQTNGQSRGLMIKDHKCFNDLVVLFHSITAPLITDADINTNKDSHVSSKVSISRFILPV